MNTVRVDTHREFESRTREYLAAHPEIPHTWTQVKDAFGGRTDVICWKGTSNEVFASLCNYQITVGGLGTEQDFEDFGREVSDSDLAAEAFAAFQSLLHQAQDPESGR